MSKPKCLDYLDTIHIDIQKLVVDNDKKITVKELAIAVGKSESSIYKAAVPNSNCNLPFEWVPVFENITEDYTLLQRHCRLTGHLPAVVEPVFKLDISAEKRITKNFIKGLHLAIDRYEDHLEVPTADTYKQYKRVAEEAIKQLLISIYYAEKAVGGNGELELS